MSFADVIKIFGFNQFRVPVLQGFCKKNTTRPKGGVEIFFGEPEGQDLAGLWGHGITFAKNLITFVRDFIVLFDFKWIRFHGIKIQEHAVIFNDTFTKHFPKQGATQLCKG